MISIPNIYIVAAREMRSVIAVQNTFTHETMTVVSCTVSLQATSLPHNPKLLERSSARFNDCLLSNLSAALIDIEMDSRGVQYTVSTGIRFHYGMNFSRTIIPIKLTLNSFLHI